MLVAFHLPPASTRSARFNHMPPAALLRLSRGLCNSVGTMSSFYAEVLGQNGSYKFFLDNEWRESASGKQLAILNPSTNAPVYSVQGRSRPGPPPRCNSYVGQPGRLQAPDPRSRGALCLDGIGKVRNRAGRGRAPDGGGGRGHAWEVAPSAARSLLTSIPSIPLSFYTFLQPVPRPRWTRLSSPPSAPRR